MLQAPDVAFPLVSGVFFLSFFSNENKGVEKLKRYIISCVLKDYFKDDA